MKNVRVFLSKKIQFLEVKFSIYLNRRVFVIRADIKNFIEYFYLLSFNSKAEF